MSRTRWIAGLALAAALGCGSGPPAGTDAGPGPDAGPGGLDAGPGGLDAGPGGLDAGAPDAGGEPVVERAPCDRGACWLGTRALRSCGVTTVPEDFSSAMYNVHRYALTARAGAPVVVTLEVTGGSWSPALLVLDEAGATLFDGERAVTGGDVEVEAIASGRAGGSASVRVDATVDTPLHLFVTAWGVVDADFASPAPPPPTDATYTLRASGDCPIGDSVCPMDPGAITHFGSGYFTELDSPYRRDDRSSHHGYDIHAPRGTEVVATQAGTIVQVVTTDSDDCGLSVNLAVESGVTFRHCHMDRVDVALGESVVVGQRLGACGLSGNARSSHVHFAYLDGPDVVGSGLTGRGDLRSDAVNAYVDGHCR